MFESVEHLLFSDLCCRCGCCSSLWKDHRRRWRRQMQINTAQCSHCLQCSAVPSVPTVPTAPTVPLVASAPRLLCIKRSNCTLHCAVCTCSVDYIALLQKRSNCKFCVVLHCMTEFYFNVLRLELPRVKHPIYTWNAFWYLQCISLCASEHRKAKKSSFSTRLGIATYSSTVQLQLSAL